jgi:hypothetical protein
MVILFFKVREPSFASENKREGVVEEVMEASWGFSGISPEIFILCHDSILFINKKQYWKKIQY